MTPGFYQQLQQRRMAVKRKWAAFFERFDVVLCPPAPVGWLAHDHEPDIHKRTLLVDGQPPPYLDFLHWAALASGGDLPAVSAPVMMSERGTPLGVQIIAAHAEDRTAIAVARMLEAITGGWKPPPLAG